MKRPQYFISRSERSFRLDAFRDESVLGNSNLMGEKSSFRNGITVEPWHLRHKDWDGVTTILVHWSQMENKGASFVDGLLISSHSWVVHFFSLHGQMQNRIAKCPWSKSVMFFRKLFFDAPHAVQYYSIWKHDRLKYSG